MIKTNKYHYLDDIKNIKTNDLIDQLIEKNSALKDLLFKEHPSKKFVLEYNDDEVTKIACFTENKLEKLLLIYFTRASYNDPDNTPILYEFTFSEKNTFPPKISLYRLNNSTLALNSIINMDLIQKNDSLKIYECFNDTPLKLTLSLFQIEEHFLICIKDNCNRELLSINSAETISDPIKKFESYLDIINNNNEISEDYKNSIKVQAETLVDKISKSENHRDLLLKKISHDPKLLIYLSNFKQQLYQKNGSLHSKTFIESVISKGFGKTLVSSNNLDKSTIIFKTKDGSSTKQRIVKQATDSTHDLEYEIREAIKQVEVTSSMYPKSSGTSVELICNHMIPTIEEVEDILKNIPTSNCMKFESLTLTFVENGQSIYYHYLINENKNFSKTHHLDTLHPDLYHYFELFRYNNFDLDQDLKNASPANFLFYARAKKVHKMPGKVEDDRLVGYSIIASKSQKIEPRPVYIEDLNFSTHLSLLMDDMEKSLVMNPFDRKPFFNRMVFQIMQPLESEQDEIVKLVKECVLNEVDRLRRFRTEKVIIKYTHGDSEYMLELKNLLGDELKLITKQIDRENFTNQISVASNIEKRELYILNKGGVWAYRIPLLIHDTVESFRKNELELGRSIIPVKFVELDLDHTHTVIHPATGSIDYNVGELIPVSRPIGNNEAGVVIGLITDDLGIGIPIKRLLIIGDLSHSSKGAIRGQECIRINAAIRYAEREKIPIDWFTASFGVQIHKERGVEGLDAAASTLREIVKNCHHKGVQINIIIDEANIGAQSYWDSMATILNDTSGILIMTPNGSMALTGPRALACALFGTLHSEEIAKYTKSIYPQGMQSLSGHQLVHGPNSDSMIYAETLKDAILYLIRHHYYSYLKPSEEIVSQRILNQIPQSAFDDETSLHKEFTAFLKSLKPDREIILKYLKDDHSPEPLRLWSDAVGVRKQTHDRGDFPQQASTIVQEMLIGGHPTLVIFTPTGPLTPADSNIISRAIYKANKRMQILIIGSLSGFSPDPLSMENRQLLEGAQIAKAVVDHLGPILIFNLGKLVGGTFIVFNKQLQPHMRILAIEGASVQVIGGKSAAKVVFHSYICKQADQDPRVLEMAKKLFGSSKENNDMKKNKKTLEKKLENLTISYKNTRIEVINEIEDQEGGLFDQFHNAQRAMKIGSIDEIVPMHKFRESIIKHFEEARIAYLNDVKHSPLTNDEREIA